MKFGFVLAAIALIVGAAATNTTSFQKQTALDQPDVKAAVSVVPWYRTFINRFLKTRKNIQGINTRVVNLGQTIMVKPAVRDPKKWAPARCNDGTPFGFDLRRSTRGSNDWVLYLEGGAFCDDLAKPCSERTGRLTTTPPEADGAVSSMKSDGIFSTDPTINPTFSSANHVFARYCSSDGWSGATTARRPSTGDPTNGWYFSGRANVRAMVEILKASFGLDDTNAQTKVLFAGSSAGGIGVETNADSIASLLPKTAKGGRFLLLDDGGFIPDFDDPTHRPGAFDGPIRDLIAKNYAFWGSRLNPPCEKANTGNPGRCFLSAVVYPYLTQPSPNGLGLPVFIQYSSIDKFSLDLHSIDNPKDPSDAQALETFRNTSLDSFAGISWVFSGGAQPYHTILTSPTGWTYGETGNTFREVLDRYWQGATPQRVIFGNP